MAELKLPDPEVFTIEDLAKRWNCGISLIGRYIETGQLKTALRPAIRDSLQEWTFYKFESDDKQLLDTIRHDEPLSKFMAIQGEFIPCPKYLYMSVESNSIMPADSRKIHNTLIYVHGLDPDTNPELFSGKYVQVRYFLDSYGNALIPIEEGWINFPPVKKEHLDSLTIIPLEEVKRFERENNIQKESNTASVVHHQGERTEQERKDSDTLSETNDDLAFKPAPNRDPWMSKKTVAKFFDNKSTSTIDKWVKAGKFPKPEYSGRNPKWRTSVVEQWRDGKWKKEDAEKQSIKDPEK